MKLRSEYQTDPKLEMEGVWHDLEDGGRIKVARLGNPRYQEAYEKIPVAIRNAAQANRLKGALQKQFDEHLSRVMAKTILVDWEGIEDEAGKPLAYSAEDAEKILADPAMRDFKSYVFSLSNEAAYFRRQELDAKGNGTRGSSKSA